VPLSYLDQSLLRLAEVDRVARTPLLAQPKSFDPRTMCRVASSYDRAIEGAQIAVSQERNSVHHVSVETLAHQSGTVEATVVRWIQRPVIVGQLLPNVGATPIERPAPSHVIAALIRFQDALPTFAKVVSATERSGDALEALTLRLAGLRQASFPLLAHSAVSAREVGLPWKQVGFLTQLSAVDAARTFAPHCFVQAKVDYEEFMLSDHPAAEEFRIAQFADLLDEVPSFPTPEVTGLREMFVELRRKSGETTYTYPEAMVGMSARHLLVPPAPVMGQGTSMGFTSSKGGIDPMGPAGL